MNILATWRCYTCRQFERLLDNRWAVAVVFALLAMVVYANGLPGTFILDDLTIVARNPQVQTLDLVTIFRSDYWHGVENSGLFRPLTIFSLALNQWLFGSAPLGFHLVNILLHAGVAALLWLTLRAWGQSLLAAALAVLFFVLHPLHTEVVNEVVGRSELLVAFFLLLGFLAARLRGRLAALLVCTFFLLALLSKEHAVTFLVLLPLSDAFQAETTKVWRQRWPLYAGLLLVAVLWLCWRRYGLINPLPPFRLAEAAAPLAYVDNQTRVLTALQHQGIYLGKLFLPLSLQAVYSVADLPSFISRSFSVGGAVVVGGVCAILGLLFIGWRRHRPLAFYAILYFIAFLPTSNILFPIGVTMAERLTYFPSLWFCSGLGVLTVTVFEHYRLHRYCWLFVAGYGLWLGGATIQRNPDFSSGLRLWSAEVVDNPKDFIGWQNLGDSLFSVGALDEADRAYRWMLEFAPDYHGGLRTRTAFFLRQKLYEQALPTAIRAYSLAQKQGDTYAVAFDGLDLSAAYLGLGDCERALSYLDGPVQPLREQLQFVELRSAVLECLGRDSDVVLELARADNLLSPRLRSRYGLSLFRLGRLGEARRQLEEAVKLEENAEGWYLLGVICSQLNDWAAAQAALARAVALQPERQDYRQDLLRAQRENEGHY